MKKIYLMKMIWKGVILMKKNKGSLIYLCAS